MVAIGGGHGLAIVLEAMVDRSSSLTAVVSVADDGGSSGRLRRDLGIVAPGDMRRCLAALTPNGLIRKALEHRFDHGVLAGHPAGNVLLASLLELEPDPVVVMDTLAAMVEARGRVLPATSEPVDLLASAARGTVKGQVAISESGAIYEIRFSPAEPEVPSAVVAAIERRRSGGCPAFERHPRAAGPLLPTVRRRSRVPSRHSGSTSVGRGVALGATSRGFESHLPDHRRLLTSSPRVRP